MVRKSRVINYLFLSISIIFVVFIAIFAFAAITYTASDLTPADNTYTNDNTPSFTFNATSNVSSTINCTLFIENSANGSLQDLANSTLGLITSNATLSDGAKVWHVECTDGEGIYSTANPSERTIFIDTVAPAVVIFNTSFNTSDSTPGIRFNFTDATSPGATCNLYMNAVASGMVVTTNNTNTDLSANSTKIDGLYAAFVNCTDNATNLGQSNQVNITIDVTGPQTTILSPLTGTNYFAGTIVVNATVADALLVVNSVYFNITNASSSFTLTSSNSSATVWNTTLSLEMLGEGSHLIYVVANDTLGNVNSTSFVNITKDTIAPSVSIISPVNGANLSSGVFVLNATVTDTSTSVNAVFFNFTNASSTFVVSASGSGSQWNASLDLAALGEGLHTMTVYANDTLNNLNSTVAVTFTVDRTAPVVNLESVGFNTTDTTPSVVFNFTDAFSPVANCTLLFNSSVYNFTSGVGNGTSTVITVNASLLDGLFIVNVSCVDVFGNAGVSGQINVVVDTLGPQTTMLSPVTGSNHSTGNLVINATVVDWLVSVQYVLFNITNATSSFVVIASNTSSVWNASISLDMLGDGQHNISIIANDTLGNINSSSFVSITKDATAPAVTMLSPVNSANLSTGFIVVNATVVDATLGIQSVYFNITNGSMGPGSGFLSFVASNTSSVWNSSVDVSTLGEGIHVVSGYAVDLLGNINATSSVSVTVDRTAPVVVIQNTSINTSDSTPGISFNFTDSFSPVAACTLYANGTGYNYTASVVNNTNTNAIVNATLLDGTYLFIVNCTDVFGNVGSSSSISVTIDTAGPQVAILNPVTGANFSSGTLYINATITDSLTYAQTVIFNITNTSTSFTVTASNISSVWNASVNLASLESGQHNITVIATDILGNVNSTSFVSITVDAIGPQVTMLNPANASNYTSGIVYINATVIDALVGMQSVFFNITNTSGFITLSASNASSVWNASIDSAALSEGVHIITGYAVDALGNINATSTASINVDRTGPSINLESVSFNTSDTTPSVVFNFTDAMSSLASCTLYLNTTGLDYNSSVTNATTTVITVNSTRPNGLYLANITCVDLFGNSASSSQISIMIDTVAPSVTLVNPVNASNYTSGSITMNATVTDALLNVNTVLFNVTNASSSFIVEASSSGSNQWNASILVSLLQDGTHTIYVIANDTLNNTNSTVQATIIIDKTGPTVSMQNTSLNTSDNTPGFSFNFTDAVSSTAACTLYAGSTAYAYNASVLNNTNTDLVVNTTLNDSIYSVRVNCTDIYGNNAGSSSINVTVDTVAPTVTIGIPADGNRSNSNTTSVNFNFTDALSPTASCTLYVNGTAFKTNTSTLNFTSTTIANTTSQLSDGSYTLAVNCTDGSSNIGTSGVKVLNVDITVPAITNLTNSGADAEDSDGGTLTVTATTNENATCWYSTSNFNATTNVSGATAMSGSALSHTFTVDFTEDEDLGPYYVSCKDTAGNNMTTSNSTGIISVTVPEVVRTRAGSSTATSSNPSSFRSWNVINPGAQQTMTISNADLSVREITLATNVVVRNVQLTVERLSGKPSTTSIASEKVYKYISIKKSNLDNSQISGMAKIKFEVDKSWLTSNSLADSEIVLKRFADGKWDSLSTQVLSSTGDKVTFEATTPGFSYFAIAKKDDGAAQAPQMPASDQETPEQPEAAPVDDSSNEEMQAPAEEEEKPEASTSSSSKIWIAVAAVVALLVVVVITFQMTRKRR